MNQLINLFDKYAVYIFLALFLFDIILAVWVFVLKNRIKTIFKGESGDLGKVLLELRSSEKSLGSSLDGANARIKTLEEALPKGLRRAGLVRYNPFSDAGGDHSFALALLNDKNDGIVLSSLYGREINRMYAKPIKDGKSQYQLTDEEIKAIENAQ